MNACKSEARPVELNLADVVSIEILRELLIQTLTVQQALDVCGVRAVCCQLPGPLYLLAAHAAWSCPRAWMRCTSLVRNALSKNARRTPAMLWDDRDPDRQPARGPVELWQLVEKQRRHRHPSNAIETRSA
ncbi:MAG: hypothetical protein AAFP04_08280 [Myxococcota bacterium]